MAGPTRMNMRQLEIEAKLDGTNQIINMFQRPGQLEKIDQYKRTLLQKKASVEALLKSAMQKQLDGVKAGLNQLNQSLTDVKSTEQWLKAMHGVFANVLTLFNRLNEVRDENMRYSQYVTARENLKNIFTVPESVEKTKQWINEEKYLQTHHCLMDLEHSRDELLFELHKLPNQSPHDIVMLKAYFADVKQLSDDLVKQLRLILSRTLNIIRKKPTVIVTALRIVEREEHADQEAIRQHKLTGFMPPGRPKQLKAMVFEVIEESVATRIEAAQIEERVGDDGKRNKLWLITYLELIKQYVLEDLKVYKTLGVSRFPPRYKIMERVVEIYHRCLSNHLNVIISNGLEGNEYVTILSWTLNTYHSAELMGHPDLYGATNELPPILAEAVSNRLQQEYLANVEKNYREWMAKALAADKADWWSGKPPPADAVLRTTAPALVCEMVVQTLDVTRTISSELTQAAVVVGIEHVIEYAAGYRDAVADFKRRLLERRSELLYYTQYMIAILNNCVQFIDLVHQLQTRYASNAPNSPQLQNQFARFTNTYYALRNQAADYLLDEIFLDIDKQFDEVFTTRWLKNRDPVDTICATLDDYFQDYGRLVDKNFDYVLDLARRRITKHYLTAMLSKRMTLKTYKECQQAAEQIVQEAKQLQQVFSKQTRATQADHEDYLQMIIIMSEVVRCESDMLTLDLHNIVDKYPDVTEEQLLRVLHLRGDLARSELRDKVAHVIKAKAAKPHAQQSTLFTQITTFPSTKLLNI